ncbi:MAG: nuclear transport factor 2 family protein [Terracidiphilus sp.]
MTNPDQSARGWERTALHLRRLEESLLSPAVRRDGERLRAMLTEDFLEFGSSGRVWTRKSIIELLATEKNFFPPAIEDFQCAMLTDKVALVTYRTLRNDGKSGESLESLRSSIWTRRDGEWRMRFHQGTRRS